MSPIRPASTERTRAVSDHLLENTCTQIGSADLRVAQRAIVEIDKLLHSDKVNTILEYEDIFIRNVTTQLQLLGVHDLMQNAFILKSYRALLTVIAGVSIFLLIYKISIKIELFQRIHIVYKMFQNEIIKIRYFK